MILQSSLNTSAVSALTTVQGIINNADTFNANKMRCYTLKSLLCSGTAHDDMDDEQKSKFECDLIDVFFDKGWV